MAVDDALGRAGGAGGVEQERVVSRAGRSTGRRCARAVVVCRELAAARFDARQLRRLRERALEARVDERELRIRVARDEREVLGEQRRRERHWHYARAQCAEERGEEGGRVVQQQ